jgi:hypothetical protein
MQRIIDGEDIGTLITQTPEDTYAD